MRISGYNFEESIIKSRKSIILLKTINNDVHKILYEIVDESNDNIIYKKRKVKYINGAIYGLDENNKTDDDLGFLDTLNYNIHSDIHDNITDGYKCLI